MATFLCIIRGQTTDLIKTIYSFEFTLLFTHAFSPTGFHPLFFNYLFPPKKWVKRNSYTMSEIKMYVHPPWLKNAFSPTIWVKMAFSPILWVKTQIASTRVGETQMVFLMMSVCHAVDVMMSFQAYLCMCICTYCGSSGKLHQTGVLYRCRYRQVYT